MEFLHIPKELYGSSDLGSQWGRVPTQVGAGTHTRQWRRCGRGMPQPSIDVINLLWYFGFFANFRCIPFIPTKWWVLLLKSWTSNGCFSNPTSPFVTTLNSLISVDHTNLQSRWNGMGPRLRVFPLVFIQTFDQHIEYFFKDKSSKKRIINHTNFTL